MPASTVIPVLAYPSVDEAVAWLSAAFGFTLRLGIGDHRAQLNAGDGAIVVIGAPAGATHDRDAIMIRVYDAHAHCERARAHGATIAMQPTDFPYGERQYIAVDFSGRSWTFSETIADVDPRDWGGVPGEDRRALEVGAGNRSRSDSCRSVSDFARAGWTCTRSSTTIEPGRSLPSLGRGAQVVDADDRGRLRPRRGSFWRGRAGGGLGAGLAVIAGGRHRRAAPAGGRAAASGHEAAHDQHRRAQRDHGDDDELPVERHGRGQLIPAARNPW
jgi:uncharacterized glyoxalase superfamily protein PhnB